MSSPRGAFVCVAILLAVVACDDGAGPGNPITPGCSRLGDYLHIAAVGRPPGFVRDAAIVDSHVFSINGTDGLFAMNFADPSDVHTVGMLPSLTNARAIASSGSWLFVANGGDGITVIDVANPASPRVALTLKLPGAMIDVHIDGDRAYFANDLLGLVIADISLPENTFVAGLENTPGRVAAVAASENLAFVALEPSELRIVNVLDPAETYIVETVDVPGFAEAVDARDGLAAVAVGQVGVQLVDVSHPATPRLAGIANTPVDAISIALAGNLAFVADANGGVVIVDVSDIDHPSATGALGAVAYSHRVRVSDGRLTIADDMAGVRVLDIAPPEIAPVDSLAADGNIRSLVMMGNLVVAADASFGLRVIDPAARAIVGQIDLASTPAKDVFVADSVAYVARGQGDPAIVDLHDPTSPVFLGTFGGGEVDHIAVVGNLGYLVDESGWLYEESINPPGNQRFFHETAVQWSSITVEERPAVGTIIYLPNAYGTVLIIAALQLRPINEIFVSASPRRVVLRAYDGPAGPGTGRLAYVAETGFNNGQAGVEVFDVTDLNAPVPLGKFVCGGNASDIAFTGTQIVVAEAEDGAEVFDLLGTARARPTGMVVSLARRVAVSQGTLVTASGKRGVLLVSLGACLSD